MQNTQAVTIARILVNEICFRFSPPQCLLSDLGSNFISEVVKETYNLFGIEGIYTSPYHPQTDGLLEKFHSTLGKNLSMYVARDHKDWDLYVRGICYGYNTSICTESTQYSPFYLMFGREPYSLLDTILPSQRNVPNTVSEYALQLAHAREVAKQNIADTQERIKLDQLVDVELPDPPVLSTQADSQNDDDTSPEYEINKIIKGRYNKEGNVEYLIDWKGYPVSARTYEQLENLNETAREFVHTHDIPIQGKKPRDH